MTTRVFRLFLSSPGDVAVERRRVAAIVSRLNGECAGRARIDVIRWETEAYQAHQTFQAQIPEAVECDLVLTVFKWRLGTELPPTFERLPTGEPYPSGTAYEMLTSIEARRQGAETPDVFVYRYGGSAPSPSVDDPERERIEQEWRRLETFFARWFVSPEGHFKAAFQLYRSEDDFEEQIEALLRRWLTEKIAAGRILAWPDAIKGSPYPGLDSYGRRHAAVFFGRERDIARAVAVWRERAQDGMPFLLVVGASGSGKSSLAKAGLVPRLTTPGVIESVDHWRVAVLRPGDDPGGPLAALAAALLVSERDLPASEEGRGPALPELAHDLPHAEVLAIGEPRSTQGGGASFEAALRAAPQDEEVGGLAFASAPQAAASRIVETLDRLGAAEQARERRERPVRFDLLLVVDQLDELFSPSLSTEERDRFVAALAAMLRTGRVWVAAALRADLYAAMLAHSGLTAIKEAGASYDLAVPGPAELAEIVRRPAAAADLAFGTDPETGESVDERVLREADRPDMLPLVQLALARLYEGRRQEKDREGRDRTVLPFDVYAGLGGLTGIIDEVGEQALAGLDEAALRTLPRLTRSLAHLEQEGALAGTLTVTPRPLAEIAPDVPSRRLVAALVASRLLTLTDAGEGGLVRLAHQRILDDWKRAREIVQGSADFYRVRGEIEARRQRWETSRRADLLLPRGLPLAEAENAVARYGDEIAPETRLYVRASRARAGRAMMLTAAAAIVFALVAIGALFQWSVAREQTALALRNFGVAREAVRGVVFDVVQGLSDVSGMRLDALRTILGTVQKAADTLSGTAPDDAELLRTRAAMFDNFARMYADVGDIAEARSSADAAVGIMAGLVRTRPEDVRVESDLGIVTVTRGSVDSRAGAVSAARTRFEEGLRLVRIGAKRAPDDPILRRRILPPLNRVGDARLALGDLSGARAAYAEQVEVARHEIRAVPRDGDGLLRDALQKALFNLGFLGLESNDLELAARSYEESLALARALAEEFPASPAMQRGLATMLGNLGNLDLKRGEGGRAVERYDQSVAIERRLLRDDPQNMERLRSLAIAVGLRGTGALALSDWPAALAAFEEQLDLFRGLVARNSLDMRNQRAVAVALGSLAAAKRKTGDEAAAGTALAERLDINRRVAAGQPDDAEAKSDLAIAIRDMAETRELSGDAAGGMALRREGIALARELAGIDAGNYKPLALLQELLRALAQRQVAAQDSAGVRVSFQEEAGVLRRMLVLRPSDPTLRALLGTGLLQVAIRTASEGDRAASAAAYDEAAAVMREMMEAGDPRGATFLDVLLENSVQSSQALGDLPRAQDAYRALVALRRERLTREPGAERRIALANAMVGLAGLRRDAALAREAVALLDELPEPERSEASLQARRAAEALMARGP